MPTFHNKYEMSSSLKAIISLLNNVSELIVQSNRRKEASDVMKALVVFANSKNIPLPEEKISGFQHRLYDARPYTLSAISMDIAKEILTLDRKKHFENSRLQRKKEVQDILRENKKEKNQEKSED